MITLDVLFFPGQIENRSLDHSAVVVVDVLRATTSIAAALSAGADGVLPVAEEPEARRTVERLCQNGEPVLLCGEIGGFPPPGFDLGNSPRDFTSADMVGKRIVLKTTNGTVALAAARKARLTLAGGLVNVSPVARFLCSKLRSNVVDQVIILCAGGEGEFSLEDFFAAGALLSRMLQSENASVETTDSAVAALDYFQNHQKEAVAVVARSHHGRELAEIGLADDIPYCTSLDLYPVVPLSSPDGWLRAAGHAQNANSRKQDGE